MRQLPIPWQRIQIMSPFPASTNRVKLSLHSLDFHRIGLEIAQQLLRRVEVTSRLHLQLSALGTMLDNWMQRQIMWLTRHIWQGHHPQWIIIRVLVISKHLVALIICDTIDWIRPLRLLVVRLMMQLVGLVMFLELRTLPHLAQVQITCKKVLQNISIFFKRAIQWTK